MDTLQRAKTCKKCLKPVQVYLSCFKCDSTYHSTCLLEAPGIYINEEGRVSCCSNITLKYDSCEQSLDEPEYIEGIVKTEDVRYFNNDLESHALEDEEFDKKDFKCVAESLQFEEEKYVINYQEKYPNVKEELSDESNKEAVGFVCSFCRVEILEEKSYEQHITWCKENYLRFSKEDDLKQNEKKYKCKKCNYSTNLKYRLKQHSPVHSIEKLFKCTYKNCKCVQSFSESCECNTCEFSTGFEKNLKKHILTNHTKQERRYKCRDCNYSTNIRKDLIMHEYIHTNNKLFKCDACDFATIRNSRLKNHVLRRHSNEEKKYKCGNCRYSSHDKTDLVRHIRIHTNEKPHKCDLCEFATIAKNHLRKHVLRKHSNEEKKYKCVKCKYSTHDRENLLRHTRTQHNEKPYKCGVCDFVTLRGTYLKKHVLAKHTK